MQTPRECSTNPNGKWKLKEANYSVVLVIVAVAGKVVIKTEVTMQNYCSRGHSGLGFYKPGSQHFFFVKQSICDLILHVFLPKDLYNVSRMLVHLNIDSSQQCPHKVVLSNICMLWEGVPYTIEAENTRWQFVLWPG